MLTKNRRRESSGFICRRPKRKIAWPARLGYEISIHFDHVLAAVLGVAHQPLTDRIDDEIQ